VLVGLASGLILSIYCFHHWRWLLLWCAGSLWPFNTTNSRLSTATIPTTTNFAWSGDAGARAAVRIRLNPIVVVVASWSKDLYVFLSLFMLFVLMLMIGFSAKKNVILQSDQTTIFL
jgi:hypothetical protein